MLRFTQKLEFRPGTFCFGGLRSAKASGLQQRKNLRVGSKKTQKACFNKLRTPLKSRTQETSKLSVLGALIEMMWRIHLAGWGQRCKDVKTCFWQRHPNPSSIVCLSQKCLGIESTVQQIRGLDVRKTKSKSSLPVDTAKLTGRSVRGPRVRRCVSSSHPHPAFKNTHTHTHTPTSKQRDGAVEGGGGDLVHDSSRRIDHVLRHHIQEVGTSTER